ncbi:MAG: glycosyltransferase [Betaproteobacteria bacterium]|nr:glycosyltransferase [Betaproteobacteria bacterium]
MCITVGRLATIKNQAMMIRAFHAAACANAKLWLVGDGPERATLEALAAELALEDRVSFIGFRHDVADLLSQSDIFLMSSNYEGVSIAVLEAMRASLPVIGTQVGGMSETVKPDTGVLMPAGDIAAMAAAIRMLADSPEKRQQLGAAGREFLITEFSINNMLTKYELLYKGNSA